MKTIEQRATEIDPTTAYDAIEHFDGEYERPFFHTGFRKGYIQGAIDQQELMMDAFKTFLATFNGAAPASYVQREFEKGMENRLKYQQEEPEL